MARGRSLFAGDTDYTGVGLEDILSHLCDWRDGLAHAEVWLGNTRTRLAALKAIGNVNAGLEYLDSFRDLFARYHSDLERVIEELPRGVRPRHVATLRQLYESSRNEEKYCVIFKQRHYLDALSESDQVQNTYAEIYRFTRDYVIDLRDLGNVVYRLDAFVDTGPTEAPSNALESKPNFMGIGLNLNYAWEQWGYPDGNGGSCESADWCASLLAIVAADGRVSVVGLIDP